MTPGLKCITCERVSGPRTHGVSVAVNRGPPAFQCMRCVRSTPDAVLGVFEAARLASSSAAFARSVNRTKPKAKAKRGGSR